MSNLSQKVAYVRKAIIQIVGLASALLALGLLKDPYKGWVTSGIAVLTTLLHFYTPNGPAPGTVVAEDTGEGEEDYPADWQPAPLVTAGQVQTMIEREAALPNTQVLQTDPQDMPTQAMPVASVDRPHPDEG